MKYPPHPALPDKLKKAGILLVIFLCVFIAFRTPISDLTFSGIKAVPDVLILGLFAWYSVSIRFKYRFMMHDLWFIAFEVLALVSTVFVNGLSFSLFVYQTRSIGIYYILYFVIRNFGYGEREFCIFTRSLQAVSVPLFLLALIEKIFCKTVFFNPAFAATLDQINYSRLYSQLYNPNTYGLFLVFVLVLSLFMHYFFGKKTHLAIYFSLFSALYLTMSRSSMMIMAVCLAVIALLYYARLKKSFPFKKIIIIVLCIGIGVFAVSVAVTHLSNWYFDVKGQYVIMDRVFPNLKQEITEVKYLSPDGKEKTGYVYNGTTFLDKFCTKPLSECGSVVFVDEKEYILTNKGGMLLSEFLALPYGEQNVLVDGNIDRIDSIRDNSYLENIKSSLDVSSGDRFSELGTDVLYSEDTNFRIQSVKKAFKVAAKHPIFGTGFGTYGSSASLTWDVPHYKELKYNKGFYADNQYACVVAETGFLGLALFLGFLFTVMYKCRKNLLFVMTCLIIGWFGIFYNILEIQIGAMILWTLLSFALPDLTLKEIKGQLKAKS